MGQRVAFHHVDMGVGQGRSTLTVGVGGVVVDIAVEVPKGTPTGPVAPQCRSGGARQGPRHLPPFLRRIATERRRGPARRVKVIVPKRGAPPPSLLRITERRGERSLVGRVVRGGDVAVIFHSVVEVPERPSTACLWLKRDASIAPQPLGGFPAPVCRD